MISAQTISEVALPQGPVSASAKRTLSSSDLTETIVNPVSGPEWDRLVSSHPDATFFHSSAWAKVLCTTYGHQPVYLRFSSHGTTVALAPLMEVRSPFTGRRGVCLPFSDQCDPLLFERDAGHLVLEKLTELARRRHWKFLEIRGASCFAIPEPSSAAFYGHCLDLRGGAEQRFARCASSARRAIRKAQSSKLKAQISFTREAILQFYKLHVSTRRRHGLPPQPLSFFLKIYEYVIKPKLGFVVLAEGESGAVAGAIFFRFGNKAIYKFGASKQIAQQLRGNNLVIWEGMNYLADRGSETLHFGRTSLDAGGLRRFKLSWGAQEETIEYVQFNTLNATWVRSRSATSSFHNRVFRAMPLALNRLAGTLIYPHLD